MKKIGFKNFRRFKDFPMIELGGCTFLVGPNNSGKSTLLKAIVHVENNRERRYYAGITDPILWDFSFAPQEGHAEHLYLGDFLSNLNDNVQEKEITFSFQSGKTDFSFVIDGSSLVDGKPSVLVPLKTITAYNSEYDIQFEWDFINEKSGNVRYSYYPKVIINWLDNKYWYDVKYGRIDIHSGSIRKNKENQFGGRSFKPLSSEKLDALRLEIDAFIAELETVGDQQTKSKKFGANDVNRSFSDDPKRNDFLTLFLQDARRAIANDFRSTTTYKYIETHNASHKVLLNPEDKNDYLAQTVLQYNGIDVRGQDDAHKFVTHWMKEFKLGVNFIIKHIYNEAYIIDIEGFDGKTKSIGYLGTGSIQLFILFLHIAMAISSYKKITLYIEEPEQNLHPALQSRLAEMFYEVWKNTDGKVEFLVETHSEYLVRQTQVIAAKAIDNGEYTTDEVNDILKVYYFPEEGLPYSMEYRQNGYFEKPFGTGFYDASGNLSRELYKIDRRL